MATKKKLLQAAAGTAAAGGGAGGLNVEEVFSTYLYDGNGSTQTITNGIDLDGEGGLVFIKTRTNNVYGGYDGLFFDTERTLGQALKPNGTNAEFSISNGFTSFNSNGFTIGSSVELNSNGEDIASWTFRKAPKFFDVVTYTGNGSNRSISHNLGGTVGMLIIKRTDGSGDWYVLDVGTGKRGYLNGTYAFATANGLFFGDGSTYQAPTSTEFYLSSNGNINQNGSTYVAYLFAHNDGDGEFGPDGDADIIKCGSYTGNGSSTGPEIDLGFEPQWFLVKRAVGGTGNWLLVDSMRGMVSGGNDGILYADLNNAELTTAPVINPLPTGFQLSNASSSVNGSGSTYIYIAIRRGPMAVPESATDVFDVNAITGNGTSDRAINTGFVTDVHLSMRRSSNYPTIVDRLRGHGSGSTKRLATHVTNAEQSLTGNYWLGLDTNDGYILSSDYENQSSQTYVQYAWKRSPNYFDAVAYTGDGTRGHTIDHNLGVAPEMIWVKNRDQADFWVVYHSALGNDTKVILNATDTPSGSDFTWWAKTDPTDSVFSVGESGRVNGSGENLIAYLFASLDGVSKVGSFSHTSGSNTDVDCGFSSGARFVLIKRTDNIGHWITLDTERGIVAGNDAWLNLNLTSAENTSYDFIDPLSSGFTVDGSGLIATGSYIFYAIA